MIFSLIFLDYFFTFNVCWLRIASIRRFFMVLLYFRQNGIMPPPAEKRIYPALFKGLCGKKRKSPANGFGDKFQQASDVLFYRQDKDEHRYCKDVLAFRQWFLWV